MIDYKFEKYRPLPTYPTYPRYHTGLYLEDYFYQYLRNNHTKLNRYFIPVSWTTCYIENKTNGLQKILNELDPDLAYFTVSQHDDAIKEQLPPNTISFCAGGNRGGIPIPLVCSQIPDIDIKLYYSTKRDLLCSFNGSNTHPLRQQLIKEFSHKPQCSLYIKGWAKNIKHNEYELYLHNALRSKFLLCPRGYGLNSFRLYESFQLGCIPVIISDKRFLPWEDSIDWSTFSIIVNSVENLYDRLANINDTEYNSLLDAGQKIYTEYFTLDSVCQQIIHRLL